MARASIIAIYHKAVTQSAETKSNQRVVPAFNILALVFGGPFEQFHGMAHILLTNWRYSLKVEKKNCQEEEKPKNEKNCRDDKKIGSENEMIDQLNFIDAFCLRFNDTSSY